jgi:hypothetical protein
VALHHAGDPRWIQPTWNRGIPVHLMRDQLKQNRFETYIREVAAAFLSDGEKIVFR